MNNYFSSLKIIVIVSLLTISFSSIIPLQLKAESEFNIGECLKFLNNNIFKIEFSGNLPANKRVIPAECINKSLLNQAPFNDVKKIEINNAIIKGDIEFKSDNKKSIEDIKSLSSERKKELFVNYVEDAYIISTEIILNSCKVDKIIGFYELKKGNTSVLFENKILMQGCKLKIVNFNLATFSNYTSFSSTNFSIDVNFNSSIFSSTVNFNSSIFSSTANFNSSIFSSTVNFNSSIFSSTANFHSSTFSSTVDFNSSTFSGNADFSLSTFSGNTNFNSSLFSGDANFNTSTARDKIDFSFSLFKLRSDFSDSFFQNLVDFNATKFNGNVLFDYTNFGGEVNFENVVFLKKTVLSNIKIANHNDLLILIDNPNVVLPNIYKEKARLDLQHDNTKDKQEQTTKDRVDTKNKQKQKTNDDKDQNVKDNSSYDKIHWGWLIILSSIIFTILMLFYNYFRRRKKLSIKVKDSPSISSLGSGVSDTPSETIKEDTEGIEHVTVNDAAINTSDHDLLGTAELAKGLSLFLCNKNTIPPITLAITGEWGSGKSSLMSILKGFLSDARFCPVWFNAWHHHKEDHMFGALLETIRQTAIPPIWRFSGIIFKLRLLAKRAWRHPILTIIIVSFFVFSTYFYFNNDVEWENLKIPENFSKNKLFSSSLIAVFIGIFGILTKCFSSFGFNPSNLFRKISSSFNNLSIKADPGLRYRVNQCLDDITWALSKKTLVVFIDDLDRCPPDQVLKVLEYSNFLSSNPRRSFIVLGMALDKVLPSISGEFNYIVEESLEEIKDENYKNRKNRLKKERLLYARNYLEKMINVEVHVPKPHSKKIKNIVDNKNKENYITKEKREDRFNKLLNLIDISIFPVLFFSFIIVCIIMFSEFSRNHLEKKINNIISTQGENNLLNNNLALKKTSTINQSGTSSATLINNKGTSTPIVRNEGEGINNDLGGSNAGMESIVTTTSENFGTTEEMKNLKISPMLLELLAIISFSIAGISVALATIFFLINKKTDINDEPTFIKTLKVWSTAINLKNNTPRHLKRSINQLRLLAMRLQINNSKDSNDIQFSNNKIVRFIVLKALRDIGLEFEVFKRCILDETLIRSAVKVISYNSNDKDINALCKILESKPEINNLFNNFKDVESKLRDFAKVILEHNSHADFQWPTSKDVIEYENMMEGITLR